MKVPFNWLKEYFDEKLDIKDVCNRLTISGTNVEKIDSKKLEVSKVVTGIIEDITRHPDAEKLVVCKVNIGNSYVQIVTGATNMVEGDIVPVALHGAILVDGMKIKKGKLRGIESQGMMCSEEELGLKDSADGLWILPKGTEIGVPIDEVIDGGGDVIEFEITSNRPDCLSIFGIAREVKTLYNIKIKDLDLSFKDNLDKNINSMISVDVKNDNCRRYTCRIIENIKIMESPDWIKTRLSESGIRPINNIVDLTNYVMLELGQPMHAFDYEKIFSKKIVIDNAKDNEKFITLDSEERILNSSMLCIKDDLNTLALAGVMGGLNSEITNTTKTIVLESGNFNANIIRKTVKDLNLRSESSNRFEKSIDDNLTLLALDRFCNLVSELGYGSIVGGTIDIIKDTYKQVPIKVSSKYINNFLGTDISKDDMIKILKNLDMDVEDDGNEFIVSAQTFRRDIFIKEDIAEEIGRIYGYDKIPSRDLSVVSPNIGKTKKQKFFDKIIEIMLNCGLSQSISYSFYSPKNFDKLNLPQDHELRNAVSIKNPLGEDYSIMRTTTIPSIIEALCRNNAYSNKEVGIFDIGKTYEKNSNNNIIENNILTIGMYGTNCDYFVLKGIIDTLFESLGITFILERENEEFFHPGKSSRIVLGKNILGKFGSIHPYVLDKYDSNIELFVGEFNLDKLFEIFKFEIKYKEIPKYPSVVFDLNIVINNDIMVQQIEKIIKSNSNGIIESFEIFDIYRGSQIENSKKSVSYSITFRDRNKTLKDEEVNKVIHKILLDINNNLGGELRQ